MKSLQRDSCAYFWKRSRKLRFQTPTYENNEVENINMKNPQSVSSKRRSEKKNIQRLMSFEWVHFPKLLFVYREEETDKFWKITEDNPMKATSNLPDIFRN